MYLMVCTRACITYAISVINRYSTKHGKEHLNDVKWILRFYIGTCDSRTLFDKESEFVKAFAYVDSNYVGDLYFIRFMMLFI